MIHAVEDCCLCVEHLALQETTHSLQDDGDGRGRVNHDAGVSEQGEVLHLLQRLGTVLVGGVAVMGVAQAHCPAAGVESYGKVR